MKNIEEDVFLLANCSRLGFLDEIKKILKNNKNIDVTSYDSICIKVAISDNSIEVLNILLDYFNKTNANNTEAQAKLRELFEETLGELYPYELSSEVRQILKSYLKNNKPDSGYDTDQDSEFEDDPFTEADHDTNPSDENISHSPTAEHSSDTELLGNIIELDHN